MAGPAVAARSLAPQAAHLAGRRPSSASSGSKNTLGACSRARQRRLQLQVAACHRCLARQLVATRPPPLVHPHLAGSRGPGSPAALKGTSEVQQPSGLEGTEGSQAAAASEQQQAAAQPPALAAQQQAQVQAQAQSAGVTAALAVLKFYKAAISPLLPPACRFLPTCSAYSMEAFQTYGVSKGFVLTAWRLFRCSPWGNSGYDPVQWPPPGLEALFGGSGGSGSDGSSGNRS